MPGTNGPEGLGEWVRPGESHNQQCAKVSLVRAGQAALTLALALRIYYFNLKYHYITTPPRRLTGRLAVASSHIPG